MNDHWRTGMMNENEKDVTPMGMEEFDHEEDDVDRRAASREVDDWERRRACIVFGEFAASRDPEDAMSEAAECVREWREQNDPDFEADTEDEGGSWYDSPDGSPAGTVS